MGVHFAYTNDEARGNAFPGAWPTRDPHFFSGYHWHSRGGLIDWWRYIFRSRPPAIIGFGK
jgi:hypothetical protein